MSKNLNPVVPTKMRANAIICCFCCFCLLCLMQCGTFYFNEPGSKTLFDFSGDPVTKVKCIVDPANINSDNIEDITGKVDHNRELVQDGSGYQYYKRDFFLDGPQSFRDACAAELLTSYNLIPVGQSSSADLEAQIYFSAKTHEDFDFFETLTLSVIPIIIRQEFKVKVEFIDTNTKQVIWQKENERSGVAYAAFIPLTFYWFVLCYYSLFTDQPSISYQYDAVRIMLREIFIEFNKTRHLRTHYGIR